MEMHQLRYMVAVARSGNFSRAAELCHVAQPSLSQQIKKLEEELGERLFDRLKRKVKLTTHGEAFLRRAVSILEEVDAAKREASSASDLLHGRITIGVLPTIAPYMLPSPMAQFSQQYPGVEIIVQENTSSELLTLLRSYEIDFALFSHPIAEEGLIITELFSEELLLALPPKHLLTRKREITASDLRDERLIVMKEEHCLGDQVLGFCDRRNVKPKISFRSAQLETVQELVHAGLGISLIPAMATQRKRSASPKYHSFKSPRPERKIILAWPRQRPPGRAAEAFIKMIPSPSS